MGLHLLLVVLDRSHLPEDDLLLGAEQDQPIVETSRECLHLVFDSASSVVLHRFVLNEL